MNTNVYVILHTVIEDGEKDIFEVVKTFKSKKSAEKYACQLEDQIDYEFNEDHCIEEEYLIIPQKVN